MSYDTKFRKQAIEYHKEGNSIRVTTKTFGVSPNTLNTWLQNYRKDGELERKYRNYEGKVSKSDLLEYLGKHPDAYKTEVAEHFGSSQPTTHPTIKRYDITSKKEEKIQGAMPKK